MKKSLFINSQANKIQFSLLIMIVFCAIVTGAYLYYRNEKRLIRNEKINDLKNISDLKADQIEQWFFERVADTHVSADNPLIKQNVEQWLHKGDKNNQNELKKVLNLIKKNYNYEGIFIVSPEGKLLVGSDSTMINIDSTTIDYCKTVIITNEILNSDLYYCPLHKTIHFDFLAPYRDHRNKPVAVFILRVNPYDYLFPLIQSWPTRSRTAETLLVKKDGDSVLFLNELRHKSNTALNLKISLTEIKVPAVKAVLGHVGTCEGIDYRGIEVLSDIRPISGSDWYMVTKIDQKEIYSELYYRSVVIVIISLMLFLLFGFGLSWYYAKKQKQILLKLIETKNALQESQEEFRTTLYSIGDAVITTDTKGFIRNMNSIAELLTGWNETDAIGKPVEEVFHIVNEESHEKVPNPVQKVLKEGLIVGLANHTSLISKKGTEIPIADSGAPVKNDKGEIIGVVLVFRDQSDERLSYKVLNSRLVLYEYSHKHSLNELFCYTLKELGIITNSTAGYFYTVESEQSKITLLAAYDKTIGLKENGSEQKITYTIEESGILNVLFNQKKYLTYNDYELLPSDKRIPGIQIKLSRILAVPVIKGKQVIAIMIIANKLEEYSQKEIDTVKLFLDFVWEIAERKEKETAIKESEKKYSDLFNLMTEGVAIHKMITDAKNEYVEYTIVDVNHSYEKHTGLKREQIINTLSCEAYKTNQAPYLDIYKEVILTGKSKKFETYFQPLGKIFHITAFKKDELHFVTVFEDITTRKSAEDKLRLFSERQSAILDSVPDIIMEVDNLKIYTWANVAGLEFFGDDVIGKEASYYFEGEQDTYSTVQPLFEGNDSIIYLESKQRRKDGEIRILAWRCRTLKDQNGKVKGVLSSAQDITEKKIAESALFLKNIVFDNSIAANSIADINGIITETNEAFRKLWGYNRKEEILGRKISDFLLHEEESIKIIHILRTNGKWNGEFKAKRKNGSTFDAFGLATDLKDKNGELLGFQSAVLDITERKKYEKEIAALNENLEERVLQRTNQLESVNKELESFSYSVSHDLRAPLRAINGFVNILTEDYSPLLDEEGKRICSVISENSIKMGMLIDNLLSFSRLGRAEMNIVTIDMQETVKTIYRELTNEQKRKRIKLVCEMIDKSYGDPVLIGQVWTNLISNAIKYTSKKKKAVIKISSKMEKKKCIYKIQDNGIGFDMTYKDKLFVVFQRLHGEKEYEGNGVGLAIVKRIIERHGGQVWAEGQLEKGSSFYFSLPVNHIK